MILWVDGHSNVAEFDGWSPLGRGAAVLSRPGRHDHLLCGRLLVRGDALERAAMNGLASLDRAKGVACRRVHRSPPRRSSSSPLRAGRCAPPHPTYIVTELRVGYRMAGPGEA